MDLDKAIAAHAEWKMKFRTAIMQKTQMDAKTITRDDCCMLGKWLHGEGASALGGNPRFTVCKQKHAEFHRQAGKVASVINAGKYDEAEAMLASGSPYGAASNEVGTAIISLKRDVALSA